MVVVLEFACSAGVGPSKLDTKRFTHIYIETFIEISLFSWFCLQIKSFCALRAEKYFEGKGPSCTMWSQYKGGCCHEVVDDRKYYMASRYH